MHTQFRLGSLKGGDHSEDLRVDRTMLLRMIFRKSYDRVWTVFMWFGIRTYGGPCEHGTETSEKKNRFLG
jgi:hypothetical protein